MWMKTFMMCAVMACCGFSGLQAQDDAQAEEVQKEESTTDALKKLLVEKAKEAAGKGMNFAEDDVR